VSANRKSRPQRWYLQGLLYDGVFEPLLKSIKKRVAAMIAAHDLYPVLDICCGTGRQRRWLAASGKPAWGLDINLKLLKYAASRQPDVPFVCADAAHLPFGSSVIKGAVISFALHEKPPEMRSRILAQANALLVPGGRIVVADFERPWNRESRAGARWTRMIERLAGRTHFLSGRDFLRRGGLRSLLQASGLVELERYDIEAGACAVVLAEFKRGTVRGQQSSMIGQDPTI
jgi:ubiquinone/menaquinone biosynthesis C-methylase UbiE